MLGTKLLISLLSVSFITLTATSLEAKSHSHFSMRVNVGEARPAYFVAPAPVYVQPAPVVIRSAPVVVQRTTTYQAPVYTTQQPAATATPVIVPEPINSGTTVVTTTTSAPVVTEYYTTPTYIVPAQPVVVKKVHPAFNWGFNWGFCFR